LRRHPERSVPDEASAILLAGLVAHVSFVADDQPFVIPMAYQYDPASPRTLYLHGAHTSRLLRHVASGAPVGVAVTLVDGLVYSRGAVAQRVRGTTSLMTQGQRVWCRCPRCVSTLGAHGSRMHRLSRGC